MFFCFKKDCPEIDVRYGHILNATEDGNAVTVECDHGSLMSHVVKKCVLGEWTTNQCEPEGIVLYKDCL